MEDREFIMPFGKYKNQTLNEIPSDYLKWGAENIDNDTIASILDKEWQWREKNNIHNKYPEEYKNAL